MSERDDPYVGLRPFFIEDSLHFFGREEQTSELLTILHGQRFLGIVGSSGSGKSSLVRAGLLPALLAGFLVDDRDRWRVAQVRPGDAPMANLTDGLLAAMGETPTREARASFEQAIRDDGAEAVREFLRSRLNVRESLFLLVDQFEEVFAFRRMAGAGGSEGDEEDPERVRERALRQGEAVDYVALMMALSEQRDLPIYVALTMRTDFLGDCDLFYGFPEALNRGQYLVPRLNRQQLRRAIEGPAKLKGARLSPRLVDHLLNELGDRGDRLPVLQHALLRTWDAWQDGGGVGPIDLAHYESAGGLEGALDHDAERALAELELKGVDLGITARVFKRLTDTDLSQRRTRSPARISELMAAASAERGTVTQIVRGFEDGGRSFVHPSADGKPDDPRVDISHESLIRQWDRLRNWVDEERRSRDQYRDLVARARKKARGEAALLQDPELKMVMEWRETAAPSSGWARRYSSADGDFESAAGYLDESVMVRCQNLAEAELQRRWKIWNGVIALVVVMAAADAVTEKAGGDKPARSATTASATPAADVVAPTGQNPSAEQPDRTEASPTEATGSEERKDNQLEQARARAEQAVSRPWEAFKKFWFLGLFGLIYWALAEVFRRVHRSVRYPIILQGMVASGGHSPMEARAKAANLVDAVVAHHTTYAGPIPRFFGWLIDWVCFFPLWFVATGIFGGFFFPEDGGTPEDVTTLSLFGLWLGLAWLYETLQITSKRQATWGMRAASIFRTDLHGQRLSLARASACFGLRLLSYVPWGLGFFIQPFTKKRQTLHDSMSGTVVLVRPRSGGAPPAKPIKA